MALKVVRFICCGMDVHKDIIVATVGITDKQTMTTEYFQNTFSTLNSDLYRLCDWLSSFRCTEVCMESTGKYWIPIHNVLEERGFSICLAHPKYTKAIKVRRLTRNIPNGFVTSISTTLSEALLFLLSQSVSCVKSADTITSLLG